MDLPAGSGTTCSDGVGNDGDGFTDCQEPECGLAPNCLPPCRQQGQSCGILEPCCQGLFCINGTCGECTPEACPEGCAFPSITLSAGIAAPTYEDADQLSLAGENADPIVVTRGSGDAGRHVQMLTLLGIDSADYSSFLGFTVKYPWNA